MSSASPAAGRPLTRSRSSLFSTAALSLGRADILERQRKRKASTANADAPSSVIVLDDDDDSGGGSSGAGKRVRAGSGAAATSALRSSADARRRRQSAASPSAVPSSISPPPPLPAASTAEPAAFPLRTVLRRLTRSFSQFTDWLQTGSAAVSGGALTSSSGSSEQQQSAAARSRQQFDHRGYEQQEPFAPVNDSTPFVAYPPRGRGSVVITQGDMNRLCPCEFFNDSLIEFYLRWLQAEVLQPRLRSRVHVFSPFLFTILSDRQSHASVESAWQHVQGWTRAVDLFDKDWLIVPINDSQRHHWSLVIIAHPARQQRQPQQMLTKLTHSSQQPRSTRRTAAATKQAEARSEGGGGSGRGRRPQSGQTSTTAYARPAARRGARRAAASSATLSSFSSLSSLVSPRPSLPSAFSRSFPLSPTADGKPAQAADMQRRVDRLKAAGGVYGSATLRHRTQERQQWDAVMGTGTSGYRAGDRVQTAAAARPGSDDDDGIDLEFVPEDDAAVEEGDADKQEQEEEEETEEEEKQAHGQQELSAPPPDTLPIDADEEAKAEEETLADGAPAEAGLHPCILHFDSLPFPASQCARIAAILRIYLSCEWKRQQESRRPTVSAASSSAFIPPPPSHPSIDSFVVPRHCAREWTRSTFPHHEVRVPQQSNDFDCGPYILQYAERFALAPFADTRSLALDLSHWFEQQGGDTDKRREMRELLLNLRSRQQRRDSSSSSSSGGHEQRTSGPQQRLSHSSSPVDGFVPDSDEEDAKPAAQRSAGAGGSAASSASAASARLSRSRTNSLSVIPSSLPSECGDADGD